MTTNKSLENYCQRAVSTNACLKLTEAAKNVLARTLRLMGITAPEKM